MSLFTVRTPCLFWDILQRTLKKDFLLSPATIRYLPIEESESVPYDLFIVLGLFCIWKTRMEFRHADPGIKSVHKHFIEIDSEVQSVYCRTPESSPEWAHLFDEIKNMKEL